VTVSEPTADRQIDSPKAIRPPRIKEGVNVCREFTD
jgi:hypothetical protein